MGSNGDYTADWGPQATHNVEDNTENYTVTYWYDTDWLLGFKF